MRHAIIAVLLLAALAGTAVAGPFEDAVSAYKRGDYMTALREFRVLAEQGHGGAQLYLGYMYFTGDGVPRDQAEAVKRYRKAAEQGYAEAQSYLGSLYSSGYLMPQDYVEAAKWYRKAAEQGVAFAQHNLGIKYVKGEGVPQNYAEAIKWYRKAPSRVTPTPRSASVDFPAPATSFRRTTPRRRIGTGRRPTGANTKPRTTSVPCTPRVRACRRTTSRPTCGSTLQRRRETNRPPRNGILLPSL